MLFMVSIASKHRHSHLRISDRSFPIPILYATPRYRSFFTKNSSKMESGYPAVPFVRGCA